MTLDDPRDYIWLVLQVRAGGDGATVMTSEQFDQSHQPVGTSGAPSSTAFPHALRRLLYVIGKTVRASTYPLIPVLQYPSTRATSAEAARVSPGAPGATMCLPLGSETACAVEDSAAPPYLFKTGRLLVVYGGDW